MAKITFKSEIEDHHIHATVGKRIYDIQFKGYLFTTDDEDLIATLRTGKFFCPIVELEPEKCEVETPQPITPTAARGK